MLKDKTKKIPFILLSFTIGIIVLFTQSTIPLVPEKKNTFQKIPELKSIDIIGLANVIILKKSPYTICIDIREKQFYDYAHIAGAVNIPSEVILAGLPEKMLAVAKKKSNTIIYCNSNSSDLSQNVGQKLSKLGFSGVKIYAAGWEEWKACELPVEHANE